MGDRGLLRGAVGREDLRGRSLVRVRVRVMVMVTVRVRISRVRISRVRISRVRVRVWVRVPPLTGSAAKPKPTPARSLRPRRTTCGSCSAGRSRTRTHATPASRRLTLTYPNPTLRTCDYP